MEKIYVHVGFALLAVKEMCASRVNCVDCPMYHFCKDIQSAICPANWDFDTFPNIVVGLELTTGDDSDTIQSVPQIE